MGKLRDLTSDEILMQLYYASAINAVPSQSFVTAGNFVVGKTYIIKRPSTGMSRNLKFNKE
jgi:hypothetical protein